MTQVFVQGRTIQRDTQCKQCDRTKEELNSDERLSIYMCGWTFCSELCFDLFHDIGGSDIDMGYDFEF